MNLSTLDMHSPVNRLRGSQLITKRGEWGTNRKMQLFLRAGLAHGQILPCDKLSWNDCYTRINNTICFWFNDGQNSTRLMMVENAHVAS